MSVSQLRLFICLAYCVGIAGPALVSQSVNTNPVKRIYVEPFATREGSETFREDVIAGLRKLKSVLIAEDESSADEIVGGGGEIWIKGYRSHNPQLGKVEPNGTPIYTGFLSIELKDRSGQTLWSYLATPPAASTDISKNLSILIVKELEDALKKIQAPTHTALMAQPTTMLKGAGATFPFPVYSKWFTNYRRENPAVQITYEPSGSAAGIRSLLSNTVDFGASDSPDVIQELAPGDEDKYLFFPSVVGAVVPVVNLSGLPSALSFTPEALAGIYLGKIKKWNDPILARSNKNVRLPNLDIVVVHRADGSGTSYAWTDFLSKTNPEWKAKVGKSLAPKWPVGQEAKGNDGVSKLVNEQSGSIGYVEFIYALQNHLSYGKVRNRNGEFVSASLESIAAAASHSVKLGHDLKLSIVDAPGAGVYPISSFTWLVIPAYNSDETKRNALAGFLAWMLGPAQRQSAALGYLPIPNDLAKEEAAAIARIQ